MATLTSIFDLSEFKPLSRRWEARQRELARRQSYYDGSVYEDALGKLGWLAPRIGQSIKPRAVNIDSGILPGFWTLAESAAAFAAARDQVFSWSQWSIDGVLYVHYGALFGVSGLRVADLRETKHVIVKPMTPQCYMLVERGVYDATPRAALWVERLDNPGIPYIKGDTYEHAEVIEPERIRTYANGRPYGFDGRPAEYANELGFVPFVEVKHINTGAGLGSCAFQDAITMLDSVNELATDLSAIIKKHAEPQWAVIGADDSELERGGDNVWLIPAGGDAKVLVPGIDIAGVVTFLHSLRDHVEASMPELAFDDLKQKVNIATATVELQLQELVLLIKRVRPNYDHGLVTALRMCGRAAAQMGLGELALLDSEELQFDDHRSVLPLDQRSQMELDLQMVQLQQAKAALLQPPDKNITQRSLRQRISS